jgi:hypothetical protein
MRRVIVQRIEVHSITALVQIQTLILGQFITNHYSLSRDDNQPR